MASSEAETVSLLVPDAESATRNRRSQPGLWTASRAIAAGVTVGPAHPTMSEPDEREWVFGARRFEGSARVK